MQRHSTVGNGSWGTDVKGQYPGCPQRRAGDTLEWPVDVGDGHQPEVLPLAGEDAGHALL